MIYCPNCGTSNREGSRFCSECGESLPSTGTRCPMCGTINPVSNVYCQECTARLVPMSATSEEEGDGEEAQPIKGVSLPTISLDEEEQGQEGPAELEEESPSENWLNELRESADEASENGEDLESSKQVEEREDNLEPVDIPDWLAEMGTVREDTQVSGGPEVPPSDDALTETTDSAEIPEQQQDLVPPQGMAFKDRTPSAEDEESLEPADIPDWLSDLRSEQSQEEALLAEKPKLEELPEWLQETIGAAVETEEPSERDERESISDDSFDRVEEAPTAQEELLPGETLSEESEVGGKPSPEPVGTPEWLQDIGDSQEKAPSDEVPTTSTETPAETFEPPEWLRDLMKEQLPVEEEPSPFSPGAIFVDEESSGIPQPADIPHWLRTLRPSQAEREEMPETPPEAEGLLKGLRGLIPASPGIEAPASYEIQSTSGTSEASRARAELLQSLLGQPHSRPRPEVEERGSNTRRQVEGWVVTVVLLVAVVGMLLAPLLSNGAPRLTQPVATSRATQLYEIVNGLDATDTVLVAFDYGPPEADELNSVVEPVLEHLIDSDRHLSIVSTRPDAPPVAAALMSEVAASSDQYTLVGYRPGAGSAASHLLATVEDPPALLLILTSRPGPLLRWIEQVQARYGDQILVATASSALLEPVTSPYLDTNAGQLDAAIHGFRGAASYETLRGEEGRASRQLDTLAVGHVAIVALMIVGAGIYGIRGPKKGEG